jgi:DNA-binding MarR family transcriptional regulator
MKSNPIPDPRNYAGFLIWQTNNAWEKFVNQKLKEFGLNQSELLHLISIMYLLEQYKEVNQTNLANFTGLTTMSVSKILRKLEKLNFVVRQTGLDSRAMSVRVSKTGKELLLITLPILTTAHEDFYSTVGDQAFIKYLKSIKIN